MQKKIETYLTIQNMLKQLTHSDRLFTYNSELVSDIHLPNYNAFNLTISGTLKFWNVY